MEKTGIIPSIETTRQLSALRQIHSAIEHLHNNQWECAITLALAAEGQLPRTDSEISLFNAMRTHSPDLASDGTFNLHRDWLKHWNDEKPDKIEISEFGVAIAIMRAVSKFYAVYGKASKEMHGFGDWCREKKYLGV